MLHKKVENSNVITYEISLQIEHNENSTAINKNIIPFSQIKNLLKINWRCKLYIGKFTILTMTKAAANASLSSL